MKSPDSTAPKDAFERDGYYLHPESVLPPALLQRAIGGLDDVRDGRYDTGEAPAGRRWNPGDDPQALCKIENPQLSNLALREAIASPLLGQLAAAVTGASKVQVWWVQLLYKPGITDADDTVPTKIGWHQDLTYWQSWEVGSELFTAWLALSDVTAEAGPMVFVTGSHHWGLLEGGDFHGQNQDALRDSLHIPQGETWREVPAVLSPGGVSFHNQTLFHGSHQNLTAGPRRSLAIHLRTENSAIEPTSGFASYLNRPEICPVIFGSDISIPPIRSK